MASPQRSELPLKPPTDHDQRRRKERPLSDADFKAMGAFRLALRKFSAFSESAAQANGLTAQQHQALLAVRAYGGPDPMSIGELAECLLIKNHSAVELVGRLVARGLVTRSPSERDRRRIELQLTAEAGPILDEITRKNLAELSSTAPVFRDLLKTLRRIAERATPDSGDDL